MEGLEALRKAIKEYQEQLSEHLMSGNVKDHEAYRHAVGKAEAFERVLFDIADIEKRYVDE
jgi:hypothetical protein